MREVTEILASLCARLYGRRAAADRAARVTLPPPVAQTSPSVECGSSTGGVQLGSGACEGRVHGPAGRRGRLRPARRCPDCGYVVVARSLYSLRKEWNAAKGVAAAWWSQCSKEAFNTGLGQLTMPSRTGRTPGPESARASPSVEEREAPATQLQQHAQRPGQFHRKVGLRCCRAPEHYITAVPVRCRQAVAASPPRVHRGLT